ncbi:hypothetical protein [Roseococcus sp.]|uniref:hypothetical protein n=1 Tax=Roseococcus sp. TaxID=2109646 RepID=UPI003BACF477
MADQLDPWRLAAVHRRMDLDKLDQSPSGLQDLTARSTFQALLQMRHALPVQRRQVRMKQRNP